MAATSSLTPNYSFIKSRKIRLPVLDNYEQLYTTIRLVGSGTFGEVVQARRNSDDLIVAIKTVRIPSDKLLKNVRLAMQEAAITQKLVGVDVPIIYDTFLRYDSSKNLLYSMVMEFIEGGDLEFMFKNLSENINLFDPDSRRFHRDFMNQFVPWLYYTLAKMHAQNIAHRDIKPSNIMYRSEPTGSQNRFVLVDLGFGCVVEKLRKLRPSKRGTKISSLLEIMREKDEYCNPKELVGTLIYSPPEKFADVKIKSDPIRADLWAAGVVLYEFIHLAFFFDEDKVDVAGLTAEQTNEKIISAFIELVRMKISCRYMPPYDRIVMESLSQSRRDRPSTFSIQAFLKNWQSGVYLDTIKSDAIERIYLEN